MPETLPIQALLPGTMSSLQALSDTCNQKERRLKAKLTSITVAQRQNGEKVTLCNFVPQPTREGLGALSIARSLAGDNPTFRGSAFVQTQRVEISINRN